MAEDPAGPLFVPDFLAQVSFNRKFRKYAYTDERFQMVAMHLKKGQTIDRELHEVTQMFLVIDGQVVFVTRGLQEEEDTATQISKGGMAVIPPDTIHEVIALENSNLLTIYAPREHEEPEDEEEKGFSLNLVERDITNLDFDEREDRFAVTITYKNGKKKRKEYEGQLTILDCSNNLLSELNNLPTSLIELYCSNNRLTKLENLPTGLKILECQNNLLTRLEDLPTSLKMLNCSSNKLKVIKGLPSGMYGFDFTKNQNLDYIQWPEVPPEDINPTQRWRGRTTHDNLWTLYLQNQLFLENRSAILVYLALEKSCSYPILESLSYFLENIYIQETKPPKGAKAKAKAKR